MTVLELGLRGYKSDKRPSGMATASIIVDDDPLDLEMTNLVAAVKPILAPNVTTRFAEVSIRPIDGSEGGSNDAALGYGWLGRWEDTDTNETGTFFLPAALYGMGENDGDELDLDAGIGQTFKTAFDTANNTANRVLRSMTYASRSL